MKVMVLQWVVYLALVVSGRVIAGPAVFATDNTSVGVEEDQSEDCCGQEQFTGVYRRIDRPSQEIQISSKQTGSPSQLKTEEILTAGNISPDYEDSRYNEPLLQIRDSDYMNAIDALNGYGSEIPPESVLNNVKRASLSNIRSNNKFGSLGRSLSINKLASGSRSLFSNSKLLGSGSRTLGSDGTRTLSSAGMGSSPTRTLTSSNLGRSSSTLSRGLSSSMLGRNRGLIGGRLTGSGNLQRGRSLSLSIDASMQVLRQALLFRSALMKQRQQMSRARQNQEILQNIGKRSVPALDSKNRK